VVTFAPFKGNAGAATMKRGDDLLATIEAVHAAGLNAELWPQALAAVARSRKQGHVDAAGIEALQRLLPHVQQAFDVARRLKGAGEARYSLERALDWLADGVALVGADGSIVYANEAFHAIARRHDGIRVRRGILDIVSAEARGRFEKAIADIRRLRERDAVSPVFADFPVPRTGGAPPYLLSVRPLAETERGAKASAIAIVFIRDPSSRNPAALRMLREVFGLTEAEASLAQALQDGVALGAYARRHAVSLNTIYTHLRRIKEKTGCRRMAELIRKLNDLQVPLRID
jgi:DNA-binding CsgD family transcriptional regulator/PAS domain-containing protein